MGRPAQRPGTGRRLPGLPQTAGERRSPGGAAPGRPQRRPRVPRGPACCTRSRPPPPWPRPRDIERLGGQRGGEPGSAPRARGPRERPRAAGQGQPRPRARTDAHAERPERKRDRQPRGAGVSEDWARPLLMARAAVGRGALVKRPGHCRAEGTAAVTGRLRSYRRAWQRCRAGATPSPQVRPPRLGAPAVLLCGGRRPGTRTAAVPASACFAGAPNARARRPLRADYRPSATSARLVGRSTPVLLPPPRKGVRAPGRGARHRGESTVSEASWRAGAATAG